MTYDYIVVGAGSAGCVVASRLSEDPSISVLLLEAGGEDNRQEIAIPAAFSKLFKSACDWNYITEAQTELDGRELYWPRGKVLGGSSSMNAMIYTRGPADDFAAWGWNDTQRYFERSEAQLSLSELRTVNPLSRAFVDACVARGMPRCEALSERDGVGVFRVTQKRGSRASVAAAYLRPARTRKNLRIETGAHATRVLFENGRASGVEFVRDGRVETQRAAREVILSGGAINSPQLLMLSGIGAADELRAHSIDVVVDLPEVGKNLQDHPATIVAHRCTKPITLASATSIGSLIQYLLFRRGMLTSNVAEAGAFLGDLEILFGPVFYMRHGFENPPGHGFSLGAILLKPESRGFVALRTPDRVTIQPNYLAAREDLDRLIDGVEMCRDIARQSAFDAYRGEEVLPGADVRSRADIERFVRGHTETLYHPVGTCAMGTVVDAEFRVRGVEGLRVVDASIMPTIVRAHPNAAVVMIAERASEMLCRRQ